MGWQAIDEWLAERGARVVDQPTMPWERKAPPQPNEKGWRDGNGDPPPRVHRPGSGRSRAPRGIDRREVVASWNRGATMHEIARSLDCSVNTVKYHLKRAGVYPRRSA